MKNSIYLEVRNCFDSVCTELGNGKHAMNISRCLVVLLLSSVVVAGTSSLGWAGDRRPSVVRKSVAAGATRERQQQKAAPIRLVWSDDGPSRRGAFPIVVGVGF